MSFKCGLTVPFKDVYNEKLKVFYSSNIHPSSMMAAHTGGTQAR